ncbi:MAG TPA: hypothetical protein VMV86_06450, partial [Methanosarcinales archaeon]|nr:hypothetical protein [Methanosarcinales archaeon]
TIIWECLNCGAYVPLAEQVCADCGAKKPKPQTIKRPDKTGKIVEVVKSQYPRAKKIVEYTKVNDKGTAFAFKILENQILDLFVKHKVPKEFYLKNKDKFEERIKKLYVPIYFGIIKANLPGAHTTLKRRLDRMYKKVNKHYGIES